MMTTLFSNGWTFRPATASQPIPVRLPHDAMIAEPRTPDAGTGNHGGYFPGGSYVYEKQWPVPEDATTRQYQLYFEGIQGAAVVTVDGTEIARCTSPYRAFTAPLEGVQAGKTALIQVTVDNTAVPNSRWYTGSGLYRQVWLETAGPTHLARDGVRLVTRTIGTSAVLDLDVQIEGPPVATTVRVELADEHEVVTSVDLDVHDSAATGQLDVVAPRPWSAEHPHLYTATVSVLDGETLLDQRVLRYGLRTIELSATAGLRINGEQVLLRGACIHHDNGVLGAATWPRAEHRRARLLKAAGYNAVRSAHNPLSRAFLDACDELGLYVMDELTDVWFRHKTPHDPAERFEDEWRDDARAMVAEDRNRPSVITYSIGNEIAETATEPGIRSAAAVHGFLRGLDPSRPTTLSVNLLLNMMAARGSSPFAAQQDGKKPAKPKQNTATTSTAANALTARIGRVMNLASRLPAADKASRGAFAEVDIAGYNYAFGRYRRDRRRYPHRVIVGSESMPGDLPAIWRLVESVPGVIGDFMWTGWDYLGEAGIGVWSYGTEPGGINKPFPALLAGSGAIDINGLPGAPVLLAQAVWGLLDAPAIAVRPLERVRQRRNRTPWRSTDALESWSWGELTGEAEIEVYSDDDEVELLLNGRSVGRKRAGRRVGFVTRFTAGYAPGELVAVGYRGGIERARSVLRTAGVPALQLRAETATLTGPDDLAYVWVELADSRGIVDTSRTDTVDLTVEGAGSLLGFGSAAPSTTESFTDDTSTTHYGRALAVIRGGDQPGPVRLVASSTHHGRAELTLHTSPLPRTALSLRTE